MSHVTVVNSYAKAIKIPTTPIKYLTDVRDEACQKFGVSKDQFTLKYNNKPISLSQQIRFANLPPGARLELVQASRSPTVISVALQLPKSRLTEKFANNVSLWEILRFFESANGANYNFTQRGVPEMSGASGSGRLYYEMPVVTVMPGHKEQASFVELQQTLSQLGFDSGSALLKLSYRNSGTPLEEAMAQISQYFKAPESESAFTSEAHAPIKDQEDPSPVPIQDTPAHTETAAGQSTLADQPDPEPMEVDQKDTMDTAPKAAEPVQAPATTNVEDVSPAAASSTATPSGAEVPPKASTQAQASTEQSRNVQIFSASTSSTPQAARNKFNENDYLPTVEHAKAHQAALNSKTRNQRLLSDKELAAQEKERQEKLNAAAEKGGALRIRMPDGTLIQMNFSKADNASGLYSFVQSFLERKNEPFKLNYTSRNGRLVHIAQDDQRLIQDLHFFNNELITFQWAEHASAAARASRKTLSEEWQAKAQALKVEEPVTPEPEQTTSKGQTVAEGKKKAAMSNEEKESKLKSLLGKGLFKKK